VRTKAAPGATVTSTNIVSGASTGETMLLIHLRVPTAVPGTGVERVLWTDPDGTTSSTKVG
jgi:hypothetical protein